MVESEGSLEQLRLVKDTAGDDIAQHPTQKNVFKYQIGTILTFLGCSIGTGNIWRFPRIAAENVHETGGLVFLLAWMTFTVLWSMPLLYIEYAAGRYTQKSVLSTFRFFTGDKTIWCGGWVVCVSFAISCYYSVVLGWCFYYTYYAVTNDLPTSHNASKEIFDNFATRGSWSVLTHALSVILAGLSVIKGVKTIERVNLVLVPLLLIIIVFTFIWSLTRGSEDGLKFLFTPDWKSFINPKLWMDAITQNAYDTGAAQGLVLTYASYMTRQNGVIKYGTLVPVLNNITSLCIAMIIFTTVFSTTLLTNPLISQPEIIAILKDSGPASTGLTFIWLPVLFSSLGKFGRGSLALFFFCVSFAGLTSMISFMELTVHTLTDMGLPRKTSIAVGVSAIFLIGLPSSLDTNFLANQDHVWGFAMIGCGIMFQAMVVSYGVRRYREEVINNYGIGDWKLPKLWEWLVKFALPVEVIFMIVWWTVTSITSQTTAGQNWYEWGAETFVTAITEWVVLLVFLISINALLVYFRPKWFQDPELDVDLTTPSYTPYNSVDDCASISNKKEAR